MFTRLEVRGIPLFAGLADMHADYLAKTSADIRLLPGEYAIHEGDTRRALFIVVEGRIEVTKFVNGTEQVIGVREPGAAFNEVPVILDTATLANFRATEPSRAMKIELKEFRALSAVAPEVFEVVTALALERVEGLQEIAAAPAPPLLTVIAPRFDTHGHDLREFLQRNSVEFDWITPDDPAVEMLSLDAPAERQYPLVRLRDGRLLHAPLLRDVAEGIGLCVFPKQTDYDLAVIGGGPAGLAAAVYGASEGLSTILIEQEAPGGRAGTSSRIENYLGFPFGISGDELAHRALQQANRLGAQIVVTRTVESIDTKSRTLRFDGGDTVHANAIILATGVSWRRLDIPSLDRLRGRGVYYGAAPGETKYVQGKDIYLVGGGNSAGQAAINFSNFAKSVTLLVRGESLASSMSHYLIEQIQTKANIRIRTHSQVVEVDGGEHLESVTLLHKTTGERLTLPASSLFILIGADAETAWVPAAIDRDERGYILTGRAALETGHWPLDRDPFIVETTVPGIFAVGDVRAGSIKRVAAAVGEGSMAVALVHRYLALR
jgi:thioredoxin reductase (NADPH)